MNRRFYELLNAEEYKQFLQAVHYTAKNFTDIIGVLAVGSLVQTLEIPDDFFIPQYNTARGLAYEQIRNPGRRRLGIQESSDLDIWICTKDTDASRAAQERVEIGGIALLSELVSGTLEWGSFHWHNKKQSILGQYYKNLEFYSREFICTNGNDDPWMACGFKRQLEAYIVEHISGFVEKVNRNFSKKIPGNFFEIRAFPESLFHLRIDGTMMPNMQVDRAPFPRVFNDQLISPDHGSLILYASESVTIYPFKKDGRVLGSRIADYLAVDDTMNTGKTYGSLVIKPDAIRKKQLDLIMTKIWSGLASFNGRIVAQKQLKVVPRRLK